MSLANFLETIKAAVKDSTVIVCLQLGETAIAQSVQAVIAQSLREHLGALLPPLSSNVVKLSDVKGKVLLMGDLDVVVDESLRELCFLRVHPFEQRAQEGGAMTGGRMTCYNVADSSLDAHGDLVQLLCKEYFVRGEPIELKTKRTTNARFSVPIHGVEFGPHNLVGASLPSGCAKRRARGQRPAIKHPGLPWVEWMEVAEGPAGRDGRGAK